MRSVRPAHHAVDAPPVTTRTSVRTCIGCRRTAERSQLLRLVVSEVDGHPAVVPDPRRRMPGRGAHLHLDPACLALAVRRKAFGRAFPVAAALDTGNVEAYLASVPASTGEAASTEHHPSAPQAGAPSNTESGFSTQ